MSLTPLVYLELTEPFALHEHGFVNGNPYILKHAIERRLYTCVPGWSLSSPVLLNRESRLIVLTATLTIEGQSHGALGTGIVRSPDDGTDKYVQALANAYKTAASDLLPRCALLFGVGWYLKTMNKDQKTKASTSDGLNAYLVTVRGSWEKAGGNLEKLTATGDAPKDRRIETASENKPLAARKPSEFDCTRLVIRQDNKGRVYTLIADNGARFSMVDSVLFEGSGVDPRLWKAGEHPINLHIYATQVGGGWDVQTISAPVPEEMP